MWTKVVFTVSAVAVQAPNVLLPPAGPTLPMPLSGGRYSVPTFTGRDNRAAWRCSLGARA